MRRIPERVCVRVAIKPLAALSSFPPGGGGSRTHRGHRIHVRRALAPLELILCLPFLLVILALIINIGIETKWKLRTLAVSRQFVWRQRDPRRGESDPRPAGWPVQGTSLAIIDNPPPPIFMQDPWESWDVVRGPTLRRPKLNLPEHQLLVDTRMIDVFGGVQMGRSAINRGFPIFPKLARVKLSVDHTLVDGQWRFWEMGYPANEYRRALLLYQYIPGDSVVAASEQYQQAAIAIVNSPLRRDLDVLDRDDEMIAWFGPPAPDFHPYLQQICSLNRFEVRGGPVQDLINRIQGPRGGGLGGVPQRMTDAFIGLYNSQIAWLRGQKPRNEPEIERLENLVELLERYKGSMN